MRNITILGVGGAGASLATGMQPLFDAKVLLANTDKAALAQHQGFPHLMIGPKTCMGRAALSPALGAEATDESMSEIEAAIGNCDLLVITAGFGGGTGTGATPVIAKRAKELSIPVLAALTLPMLIERERRKRALEGMDSLTVAGIPTVIHDLAKAEGHLADMSLTDLLEEARTSLAEMVRRYAADSTSVN